MGFGFYYNFKCDKYIGFVYSIGLCYNGDFSIGIFGLGLYSFFFVKGKGCVIVIKFKDFNWSMKFGFGWYNLWSKGL